MKKIIFYILSFFVFISLSFIPKSPVTQIEGQDPPFYMKDTRWADSVFKTLTPDERLAQLFMVAAYSNKDNAHVKEIKDLVDKYKIGGLIFFQGGPIRQAIQANCYQSCSKVPLFMSIDAEWGLAMRLDSTTKIGRASCRERVSPRV